MGRHLRAYRRLLAALFAAAGTGFGLLALRPEPAPTGEEILVAARDLPGGATVRPSDFRTIRLPPTAIPAGALSTPAQSRVLAGPMRRGEPLTDVRLISSSLLNAYGPDTVATPVRIADAATARLLHHGDHVDVLATSPLPTTTLPTDALPTNTPPPDTSPSEAPTGATPPRSTPPSAPPEAPSPNISSVPTASLDRARLVVASVPVLAVPKQRTGDQGALVVLATDRPQAAALAGAGPNLALSITKP